MQNHSILDMTEVIKKTSSEKPLKGSAYIEKQLTQFAPQLHDLIEKGYSEEQIFNNFPQTTLEEIGMDKKAFIRTLKTVIKKYLKAAPAPAAPISSKSESPKPVASNTNTTEDDIEKFV